METHASLRDQVINKVKNDIQKNILKSGQIITEIQISSEMKISRTPVREGLIQLCADGILEKVPRKGYKIEKFDNKSKTDIYVIYAVLDSLAAKLAIDNITESDIAKMNEYVDKMAISIKYQNYTEYYTLQHEFHRLYVNKCGNPYLIKIIDDINSSPINISYVGEDTEKLFATLKESNEEHKKIVELFAKKQVKELEEFLKHSHWETKYIDLI